VSAYYNEHDAKTAAWLRELIKAGLIADGEVDTRSITDVAADDVRGFTQCHFFAGIGGWSYALRLAGWPDDRHVWTGSCPCQPFSAAGKGDGAADSRHLWPTWFRLIAECRPGVVFGEQVASADGLGWFDRVSTDMEAADYAIGAVDLCAPSVGAFHIRQRLWFVADTMRESSERGAGGISRAQAAGRRSGELNGRVAYGFTNGGEAGDLAYASRRGLRIDGSASRASGHVNERQSVGELAHASGQGPSQQRRQGDEPARSAAAGFWDTADWLPCADGKARPVEPGTFPLAHGVPARVGRLRGYGNAIVPEVAAAFINAYLSIGEPVTAPAVPNRPDDPSLSTREKSFVVSRDPQTPEAR
jgi:DNA (cytosine-5)-methyltransferase 1